MSAPQVSLAVVTPQLKRAVRDLAPKPAQVPWSGTAASSLSLVDGHPERMAVAGFEGEQPVGFLVLDTALESVPGPGVVGVRGFFVDRRHQGRGVAAAMLAALPSFVRVTHPTADRIALTVNVRNDAARRAYLRAGFRDTGRLYYGGALGPQHVLELALEPAEQL
jgi:RimJ/RimL family protein N-acetyltransferase